MVNRHRIEKLVVDGTPYVNADKVADWIADLRWNNAASEGAASFISQELRLMGLSDGGDVLD